jgi:ribosomal protein L7Ae-like RNA K-turn-binding protein
MDDNAFQLLGLAMRAGKVVSGEEQVLKAIRFQKAKLVLLSMDASQNTSKRITDKAAYYDIPLIRAGLREQLGQAIGKEQRVVIAVSELGLASKIKAAFEEKTNRR